MNVSVIIPTFNCGKYLPVAIESALSQSYRNLEVIVVDDGSTDDTRNAIEPFMPRLKYVYQRNLGLPGARNTGIEHSSGDIIGFLDADDTWHPRKLEAQLEIFQRSKDLVLVHSDVVYLDEPELTISRSTCDRRAYQGSCYQKLFFEHRILPSSVIARRDALLRAGCFDASLTRGCEDYDLWIRMARLGDFGFVDEPLVYYRRHANNMSKNTLKMAIARIQVIEKALSVDPQWGIRIGREAAAARLFGLYSDLAYQYWQQSRYRDAEQCASRALEYGRSDLVRRMRALGRLPAPMINCLLKARRLASGFVRPRTHESPTT